MSFPPIEQLIAQRGPMLLLAEVQSFEGRDVCCRAVLTDDCVFFRDGSVPGVVSLELMAQTAGAFVSLGRASEQSVGRLGYLVAVQGFEITVAHLPLNRSLLVRASQIYQDAGTAQLDCEVRNGMTQLSRARLTVFEPSTPSGQASAEGALA